VDVGLIYLASPYTHEDPIVMQERYERVCEYTAKLKRAGRYVFSPIAHCHGPALHGLPKDYEYWKGYCELMLPKCDEMVVLMLDGYMESRGISEEVLIAKELNRPIWFAEFDEIPI
jgi:hypothetical protein